VGNIAGPFFYKEDQSPGYSLGIWSMIVSHLLEILVVVFLWILLSRENRRRDNLQDAIEPQSGGVYLNLDLSALGDLTDKENLDFRHVF
jgi:hypothetical protein